MEDNLWTRYQENFIVAYREVGSEEGDKAYLEERRKGIAEYTGMGVTLEQAGDQLQFLECQIGDPQGVMAITVKDVLSMESACTQCQLHKMLCPMAPNIEAALVSSAPNAMKKCQHYRISTQGANLNVSRYRTLFQSKGYPHAWWEKTFRVGCIKCGLRSIKPKREGARGEGETTPRTHDAPPPGGA